MNRKGKAATGFAWAGVAKDVADRAGYELVSYSVWGGLAFKLPRPVSPCIQFFIQRVASGQVAPLAFVGIYVEAFEREWRDRLLQTNVSPDLDDLPFGLHVANISSLRPRPWVPTSPSDEDVGVVDSWLARVFEYAKRLPSSMDALVSAIETDKIADHNLEAYRGHSLKVCGFVRWLRRTRGVDVRERLMPLLTDQTEPYDVGVMLGEP